MGKLERSVLLDISSTLPCIESCWGRVDDMARIRKTGVSVAIYVAIYVAVEWVLERCLILALLVVELLAKRT